MKRKPSEDATTTASRIKLLKMQKRIAIGDCDKHDHLYWAGYMDTNADRRNNFIDDPDTINIVTTNQDAAKLNADFVNRLSKKTKQPVFSWNAWNSNATALRADLNDVRGMRNFLGVCIGAPILLLTNLYTDAGLANGTRGILRDVIFAENSAENDLPLLVVCDFPDYSGPVFPLWKNDPAKRTWVPISTQTFAVRNRKTGSRTQIPIVVAKALTTWKAQGMSLDKIYVHVSSRRNKNGLLYTAISRVTNPEGLLISAFEEDLLYRIARSAGMQRVRPEVQRLNGIVEETKKWMKLEEIDSDEAFNFYYDPRIFIRRESSAPRRKLKTVRGAVSAAMDITNYTGDILGSEIADHTFAQNCAWRRRMHAHNSQSFDIEKILTATPAPLGRHTTKKRKRITTSSKKRQRKASTKCLKRKQ